MEAAILESNGAKTVEEWEADGWKTIQSMIDETKAEGKYVSENKLRTAIKALISSGKWESIETQCPLNMGRKVRKVFYRPIP